MAAAVTDSTIILGFTTNKASASLVGTLALISPDDSQPIAAVTSANFVSDDGPNATTQAHGGFAAADQMILLVQTDISESKKRVGIYNGAFTWSSWGTFDNSFDLMVNLDVLANSETMTLNGMSIYDELATEAAIVAEIVLIKSRAFNLALPVHGFNISVDRFVGGPGGFHGFNV